MGEFRYIVIGIGSGLKKDLKIILFYCLMLFVASCGKQDFGVSDGAIEFGVPRYSAELKAVQITGDNISNFGVFAALESSGIDFSNNNARLEDFMDNVKIKNYGTAQNPLWKADPVYYWPVLQNSKLSFFAYAPYSGDYNISPVAGWVDSAPESVAEKTVEITYTLDSNPARHADLCVASASLNRKRYDEYGKESPVEFEFEHTLASVTFVANYKGTLPDGCELRIEELVLNNMVNSNTLVINAEEDDFYAWKTLSESSETGNFLLNIGSRTLVNKPIDEEEKGIYTEFVSDEGVIYALPQRINSDNGSKRVSVDVGFSYVKSLDHSSVVAQFNTSYTLPEGDLLPSKRYKYMFTIDVSTASLINFTRVDGAWIEDWQDSENNGGNDNAEIK